MSKQQLHKRFEKGQVIAIMESYLSEETSLKEAMKSLEVKRSRFFKLLSNYRNHPDEFDVKYARGKATRGISEDANKAILEELEKDKKLIDNKDMPIKYYNYSAIKDNLEKKGFTVSVPTVINRAKNNDYYIAKPKGKAHDREVITNFPGELLQHDSSHHLWSPYIEDKLYLITTIDDYSRLLLYAELVEKENVWNHILALKSVFLNYGCPLRYYPDQHAIFRYVKDRDKNRPHNVYSQFTDDVDPQWKQVLKDCGVGITYALSPQAKGKVERPYRWLQDRIVRIAAKEEIKTLEGLREVLKETVDDYNTKKVHSTTKEIPIFRFEKAIRENRSLFKPFKLEKENQIMDDIFCLRAQRIVDSYRKISLEGVELKVPNGITRQSVDLKMVPDMEKELVKIRFWQGNAFLGEALEKMENMPRVQF
jgi:hypothetical protein